MIDLSQARYKPAAHQVTGVEALINNPFFFLADEMGAGKTKQVIDAAHILYERRLINQAIVVTPAPVRSVWFDPELGELKKHLWNDDQQVLEYHRRVTAWGKSGGFRWIITNYEFIRNLERLRPLLKIADKYTWLVLDESSFIKSHRAQQTKASMKLRKKVGRVTLLNGTPIAHSPMDLFTQSNILHRSILDCQYITHFRSRYCIMGGYEAKTKWGPIKTQVVKWKNLDDLQQRLAPYVLRRETKDFQDWPTAMEPIAYTLPLTPTSWKTYRNMRDDLIHWLNDQRVAVSPAAATKVMRLAQICSGFLGGIQEEEPCPKCEGKGECPICGGQGTVMISHPEIVEEIGTEKLKFVLDWVVERQEQDPNIKLLIWCRFRAEVERLHKALQSAAPQFTLGLLWGAQSKTERAETLRLLDPRTTPEGPVAVVGTPQTGALGLNMTASRTVLYVSNDIKLYTRLQSMKRVDRIGQTQAVWYGDVLASGPTGQRTVDHVIAKGLRDREDLATWTCSAWVKALKEDTDVRVAKAVV